VQNALTGDVRQAEASRKSFYTGQSFNEVLRSTRSSQSDDRLPFFFSIEFSYLKSAPKRAVWREGP
jgi:hypothetical protein